MNPNPKTLRQLIVRDIVAFLLVGSALLFVFILGQDSLNRLMKEFASRRVSSDLSEELTTGSRMAADSEAELHSRFTRDGWKEFRAPSIPFTLAVPENTVSVEPMRALPFGDSAGNLVAYRGTIPGELELSVQWGETTQPWPPKERARILRQEPSRLLSEQGLKPRVGLSEGRSWKSGSLDLFEVSAELEDGRNVVTRYYLGESGVLQVQLIFLNKQPTTWPVQEIYRSVRPQSENDVALGTK